MAAYYEIRIKGRVGDSVLLAFEGLTVTTEPVETVLHGAIPDQDALQDLLVKVQSLGLEVVELRRLPAACA
jgi:malate/lactate dehydrogenase